MFEHYDGSLEFQDLETIQNEDGKRWYVTPEGKQYPSITTVLSSFKKSGITNWRKRVGEEQANKIMNQASNRGTNVHLLCEDYLNNKPGFKDKHVLSNIQLFNDIKPFLDENISKVYAQECPLYSDYLGIAGRTDCVAVWKNQLSIIDFKTSSKPKKREWIQDYFAQCSGYAVMFEERTKIPIANIVIVMAVENELPEIYEEKRDDHIWRLIDQIREYKNENPVNNI
jgi:genome maintenance exonuclease 1